MTKIIENIALLIVFGAAVIFLVRKFFNKNGNNGPCGGKNCDC